MPINNASTMNPGVSRIYDSLFSSGPGKIAISNRSSDRASSVIVTDNGVKMTNSNATSGVWVGNDGVMIQGDVCFTASGESIRKGQYTENPRSNRLFSYTETVLYESIPKDILSSVVNIGSTDGVLPMVTDVAPGPTPHFHTISTKHVHRVDPAYLYRIPSIVGVISGSKNFLIDFFKTQ
jgi:hypothetical protein